VVVRAHRSGGVLLAPEAWISRLQSQGWALTSGEPGDPEVTEPTPLPLSTPAVDDGSHAPVPAAVVEPSRRRRRGAA
jgi:hypothetical protein